MVIKFSKLIDEPTNGAILLLEDEYKQTGDIPTLRNLNFMLMDMGNWQYAKSNWEKIIEESEHIIDGDLIDIGMVNWFTGNELTAIDFWKRACDAEYTDAAGAIDGPLILWYAGQRLGDQKLVNKSLKKLKRFWRVKEYRLFAKEWPGTTAIAGFLLDKVPEDVFLNDWKWSPEPLEYRRLCRANFWVGMKELDKSEDKANQHFKTAFSANKIGILEYEYFLAKWEYSRLTKNSQKNKIPSGSHV